MSLKRHLAASIAPPFSAYSHAVEVPPGLRSLQVSGQVGVAPDGTLPESFTAQCEQAFHNLFAILEEAGMGLDDVVKLGVFLTRSGDVAGYRDVRDRLLEGRRPASTLLVVAGLANPRWLVEIELVAAAR